LLPIPTAFVYKDTAMTTTLIQWNGKQGIAQTDSGGQYPVARHQLDYAPYAIGSRIRIYPYFQTVQKRTCRTGVFSARTGHSTFYILCTFIINKFENFRNK